MTHSKVINLVEEFITKIALDEEKTNPGRDIGAPAFVGTLDQPHIAPIESKSPEQIPPQQPSEIIPVSDSDKMTRPGAPAKDEEEISYTIQRYFRTIFNSLGDDITTLKHLGFFQGYKTKEMPMEKLYAYKTLSKLYDFIKRMLVEPKEDLFGSITRFLNFVNDNRRELVDSAEVLHNFLVVEHDRLDQLAIPTIVAVYKKILSDPSVQQKRPDLVRKYDAGGIFETDLLTPRHKVACKLRKIALHRFS